MHILSRGRLLAPLVCVLAGLLAPTPAAAADDVYLLAAAGDSNTPQDLTPLVQTATGIVYRNEFTSTIWVKPHDPAQPAQEETRLADPTVVGDLLSTYDTGTSTLRWRTIADATLHETVLPAELTFLAVTATGYLAIQGTHPSDLVAVDLLSGGSQTVIGAVDDVDGLLTGPRGAAVRTSGEPGAWLYFPFDGSVPGGQPVQAPDGSDECALSAADLLCWSSTQLTRLPLTGAAGTTVAASPRVLVASPVGVVYTVPDPGFVSSGWHQVWAWRWDQATPVRLVDGNSGYGSALAPVTGGTGVALTSRSGLLASAGIIRFSGSTSFATSRVVGAPPQPRIASAMALGTGRVVWFENSAWFGNPAAGGIVGRDLIAGPEGGLVLGPREGQTQVASDGTGLSVSGSRVSYGRISSPRGLHLTVTGDPRLDGAEIVRSTLSGQRLLWQSREADGVLSWQLTDLTAKTTAPLADAVSYDLWGERLARLDAEGSVWLQDLRTGGAPVELAPALDGGADSGTVHVAGDVVAWDVTPADADAPDPGVLVRDVASMDPAEPVIGLAELQDLSTGYAVGCGGDGTCSPLAVSLLDGAVTPVATERPLTVDGNVLGVITTEDLPAVRTLPQYDDAPRLLGPLGIPDTIDVTRRGLVVRLAASQPLTSCAFEILDHEDTLVRSLPCTGKYGAATVSWNGEGSTPADVPDGTYHWRIVAANGDRPLVDYDGSPAGVEGTLLVNGVPEVVEMIPDPGLHWISRSTSVTVRFDEPVTGVSASAFRLRPPGGTAVPAVVTYDDATRTATLKPEAPLSPLTRYGISLDGITDLQGTAVPAPAPDMSFSTGPASNASHCSLVMPTKVVIDARSKRTDVRIASNCTTNQADHAYWNLVNAAVGGGWELRFESADLEFPNWYVNWPDTAPMGRWTLTSAGAERADGVPLPQNSAVIQAKYASRLTTKVARTSTSLSWAATATQWSGSKHAWTARPKVTVGLFHLPTGSSTWKYVKSATTSSTGKATVTLGSPKAGSYRLTVAEIPTVWASYSTPVRGR